MRRNWQHYFKLNANYNYGSSDIYNQNYQGQQQPDLDHDHHGPRAELVERRASFARRSTRYSTAATRSNSRKGASNRSSWTTERWLEEQRIKGHPAIRWPSSSFGPAERRRSHKVTAQAQYRLSEADFINGKLDAQTLSRQKNIENVAIREYEE